MESHLQSQKVIKQLSTNEISTNKNSTENFEDNDLEELDLNNLDELDESDLKPLNIQDFIDISNKCCFHKNTTKENNIEKCSDCGLELISELSMEPEWRMYSDDKPENIQLRCRIRKTDDNKNIFKDLETYNLPKEIQIQTNMLYNTVTNGKILRANNRKAIIYACVLHCFKSTNNEIPEDLIDKFNLKSKDIAKGLKEFKLSIKKTVKTIHLSKEIYIVKVMKKFNADDKHIERVKNLYNLVKNKHKTLMRSHQQSVMISLIYVYWKFLSLSNIDYDISIDKYSKIVNLSVVTISRLSKIIAELFKINDKINL